MADEEFMFGDLFATVRVQDLPASREVVAVERQENGTWRVCGSAIANTDGIAELGIEGSKTSRVYAFAIDHWGELFTPNRTVAYGDIIRPSVFLGWLYRVTAPGVLPGEEPVWWNSTPGMPRPVGSAMAQAEMYFQPIAHGPVDIEWEEKGVGDPHWDKVVSLLHFDEVPLSADAKGKLWTITNSGNVELSTAVKKFGNAVRFGRSGYGYLRADASSEHDLGAEDFTIEFWMYKPTPITQNGSLVDFRPTGFGYANAPTLYLDGNGGGRVTYFENGSLLIQTDPIPANTWIHIALCRLGNLITMYENGLAVGTTTKNNSFLTNLPITIGQVGDSLISDTFYLRGYLDEVRITKGVARYTENFTPPTEPFPNFK